MILQDFPHLTFNRVSNQPTPAPPQQKQNNSSSGLIASNECCTSIKWLYTEKKKTAEELDHAIRQIISKAVVSDEVVDIFAAVRLKKPDISILSDEFLADIRGMPHRNLAVELLC